MGTRKDPELVQAERDEKQNSLIAETMDKQDSDTQQSVSLPSTEYPMVLSESDVTLMKRIVLRYRGVYDYLADR